MFVIFNLDETKFHNPCLDKLPNFRFGIWMSLCGFEPPTFQLTAERGNQLRHISAFKVTSQGDVNLFPDGIQSNRAGMDSNHQPFG